MLPKYAARTFEEITLETLVSTSAIVILEICNYFKAM
jgi:hypothetical protein